MQLGVAAALGADLDQLHAARRPGPVERGHQLSGALHQVVPGAGGGGERGRLDAVRSGEERLVLGQPGLVQDVEDPAAVVVDDNND